MYNRYLPQEIEMPASNTSDPPSHKNHAPFSLKNILSKGEELPFTNWKGLFGWGEGREGDPLEDLLKSLKLDGVDSGDILLVLLILFLLIEGDDQWELIITLGLLLIMGLADETKTVD